MVTKAQLEEEARCRKVTDAEREKSDLLYSLKWVERMAIWAMTIIGGILISAWVYLIIRK